MGASSRRIPLAWATTLDQEEGGRFVKAEGDRALLFRARDGDEKACRELLDRHGQRLLSVVVATQGDPAIAEDVVQETFIRAIREADKLREEASVFPWLVKIALRAGIDYRRKIRRETLTDVVFDVPDAVDLGPEMRAARSEDSRAVERALMQMKPYPRELIVLRYFASFSTQELAAVFGKSEAAIRKDLQRARDRARKILSKAFGGRDD